jgi:hypothetical protein
MPAVSRRLLLLPLCLALAHCGGGGGGDSPVASPSVPPVVSVDPYAGTAYLKVQVTTHAKDGGPGLGRAAIQAGVDQCNEVRRSRYALPAQQPDDATMAGIDVQTVERFFDNGKAAETNTGYTLKLYDYLRWTNDLTAGAGTDPKTPPDCSAVQKVDIKSGTLWLDSVKYDLRFDTQQAIGTRGSSSFTPTAIDTDDKVAAWPKKTVLGETCLVASGPSIPTSTVACLWDRFPAKTYLNLPWALESTAGTAQDVRIVALELQRDKALPAGAVAIPAGFTTKVSD